MYSTDNCLNTYMNCGTSRSFALFVHVIPFTFLNDGVLSRMANSCRSNAERVCILRYNDNFQCVRTWYNTYTIHSSVGQGIINYAVEE
jgi:hypothetical protein